MFKFQWKNYANVSSNGVAALIDLKRILARRAPHNEFIHCIMYRQATRKVEPEVQEVLQDVISVVNCMKTRLGEWRGVTSAMQRFTGCHGRALRRVRKLYPFAIHKDEGSGFADLVCDDKRLPVVYWLSRVFWMVKTQCVSSRWRWYFNSEQDWVNCFVEETPAMVRTLWKQICENISIIVWLCCQKRCASFVKLSCLYTWNKNFLTCIKVF